MGCGRYANDGMLQRVSRGLGYPRKGVARVGPMGSGKRIVKFRFFYSNGGCRCSCASKLGAEWIKGRDG